MKNLISNSYFFFFFLQYIGTGIPIVWPTDNGRPWNDWEVVGLNPDQVKPKHLQMAPTAFLSGTQH